MHFTHLEPILDHYISMIGSSVNFHLNFLLPQMFRIFDRKQIFHVILAVCSSLCPEINNCCTPTLCIAGYDHCLCLVSAVVLHILLLVGQNNSCVYVYGSVLVYLLQFFPFVVLFLRISELKWQTFLLFLLSLPFKKAQLSFCFEAASGVFGQWMQIQFLDSDWP